MAAQWLYLKPLVRLFLWVDSHNDPMEQVVRCGYGANSPRLDDLLVGAEIEAVESRINPMTNIPRVRLDIAIYMQHGRS